jgi:2'-5' RNA ligase
MELNKWRVFCAVEIPHEVTQRALKHIAQLQSKASKAQVSWNREGKFHLTLKFFGHIPQPSVADVSRACEIATKGFTQFPIVIGNTGAFPKHGPPRVLWIGIDDVDGKLAELHRRLEDACSKLGLEREERAFHPHLTMARLRAPQGARELAQLHQGLGFQPRKIEVRELLVFRSELSPHGSKYSVISSHPLSD